MKDVNALTILDDWYDLDGSAAAAEADLDALDVWRAWAGGIRIAEPGVSATVDRLRSSPDEYVQSLASSISNAPEPSLVAKQHDVPGPRSIEIEL